MDNNLRLRIESLVTEVEMGNCCSFTSSEVQERNNTQKNIVTIDRTLHSNGYSRLASIYSRKGTKEINQDAAIIYQGFGTEGRFFCGVFDGHGQDGEIVSKLVRNRLPKLILSQQEAFAQEEHRGNVNDQSVSTSEWRRACVSAFKVMDKEIKHHKNLDSTWCGTTAVTIIIQGEDVIISNLGDSRAILGTITGNAQLTAVQLTNDLKPSLPNEADRIRKCNGRIFALEGEPSHLRVWLPNDDRPGLTVSRCFGDFGIKNHGVLIIPQMRFHQITDRDRFIVLATDGVWDVLTNEQVTSIVWSVTTEEKAAKAVVDAAVSAWKQKHPCEKMDDCTAICVFLHDARPDSRLISVATTTSPT